MNSTELKIHILYEFNDGPWGGANQFLKALKKEFIKNEIYAENIKDAHIVLINSINAYKGFKELYDLRKRYTDKIFVHRVDGPVFLGRGRNKCIDKGIFKINSKLADATIYQSKWSKQKCFEHGMKNDKKSVVILNSPNNDIFYPQISETKKKKKTIIASSWSDNWNKGFKYYQYLDEHIDTDKYKFVFVGNSPIKFKNAVYYPPQNSTALAEILRTADIYLTACKNDACSNSLIEALTCGLPAVVLKDGGNPEIIGSGGRTFENEEGMIKAIDEVCNHYDEYKENIPTYDIRKTANEYIDFFNEILNDNCVNKKVTVLTLMYINICYFIEKIENYNMEIVGKINRLKGKLHKSAQ